MSDVAVLKPSDKSLIESNNNPQTYNNIDESIIDENNKLVMSDNMISHMVVPKSIEKDSNLKLEETINHDPNFNNNDQSYNDAYNDDNGSVLVIILQCETKPCDNNILNLKWGFSDPFFIVQICSVDPPTSIPSNSLSVSQYVENYFIRKALTYSAEGPYITDKNGTIQKQYLWTDIPCIIIKDSSITNITSFGATKHKYSDPEDNVISGMHHRIKVALDKAKNADLFFLCKWNDACDKYTNVNGVNNINHGSTLKWSTQPTSTQAIMYTPSSRDFVRTSLINSTLPLSELLNTFIKQGKLLATVFVPNIIDFDIDLATSNDDYAKLNECAPPLITTSTPTTSYSHYFWIAIIIIIAIIVLSVVLQMRY